VQARKGRYHASAPRAGLREGHDIMEIDFADSGAGFAQLSYFWLGVAGAHEGAHGSPALQQVLGNAKAKVAGGAGQHDKSSLFGRRVLGSEVGSSQNLTRIKA
jgi:hypothetical protein